jgi:outer membrane immunogenic protein
MRRLFVALTSTVSVLAFTHMASAADLRVVTKAPPPLPPPVQDWSGVYVGLEGGYGWGKQNFDQALDPFFLGKLDTRTCFPTPPLLPSDVDPSHSTCTHPTIGSVSQSGWLAGGHAGVQKQWGSWVLGIEASIDAADIKGDVTSANTNLQLFNNSFSCGSSPSPCRVRTVNSSQSLDSKIDLLGFVGPKVGWAWSPNWMIYATGGLAFAHKEDDWSFDQTHFFTRFGTTFPTRQDLAFNGDGGVSMFGWAVGGGLDYKWQLDAGSAVVFGVQYLHYQFGKDTLTLSANGTLGPEVAGSTEATNLSIGLGTTETVDVIKGRISYLFSIH